MEQLVSEENPVNFVIEVRVPCLICGVDVEIDSIVKQEVSEEEGDESCENGGGYQVGVVGGQEGGNLDHNIFHWFLKWFRVDIVKKGKQRLVNRGWDGHGGDILRFCGGCKRELMEILELQKQLDELEERIKNGLGEVKGKMAEFEEGFQSNGIYERDQRYKRVRSRIVKSVGGNSSHCRSDNPHRSSSRKPADYESSSRRSTRRKDVSDSEPFPSAPASNAFANYNDANVSPVVMLSSLDKACDEEHLIISDLPDDIKPDIWLNVSSPSSSPTFNSPVIKIKKTIKKRNKANVRKITEVKNKSIKKKPLKTSRKAPKKERPLKNYFLDDDHDDYQFDRALEEDKPLDSDPPLRKRRKVKDADFIPDDNLSSEDDSNDLDWNAKPEGHRKLKYTLDPSTNMITFGSIQFSISGDLPKNNVTCTSCSITLKNDKDCMRRHITKYHTNRFACPQCPFRASGGNVLDLHIKGVHEGLSVTRKFPCKICGKLISQRKNHEWTHMNKEEQDEILRNEPDRLPDWLRKKWQCEECGKSFMGPSDLKKHKERIHEGKGSEKVKELCPKCGKSVVDLKNHLKYTHGDARNFECTEQGCGKRFKTLHLLTRHKNAMHRKLKPWKCTMCTREFAWEECLKRHMDLHMGIRPWKCEVEGCGGAFATKGNLRKHFKCFHEEGSKPRRKSYQRGPTVLGVGFRKDELVKKGTYYPPSALNGWAKGRVPGHLMEKGNDMAGQDKVENEKQ